MRNDRVLHTRIPEQLEGELRDRAVRLGLPVSALVRNVLLHTFDLVGDLVQDSHEIARQFRPASWDDSRARNADPQPAPPPTPEPATPLTEPEVLAWQPGILNLNAVCLHCNVLLPKGTAGAIGMPTLTPPRCLCTPCLRRLEAAGAASS